MFIVVQVILNSWWSKFCEKFKIGIWILNRNKNPSYKPYKFIKNIIFREGRSPATILQ